MRAFARQPDSFGRLLVLLHADFGAECELGRDVFYSWRSREEVASAFNRVLIGELLPGLGAIDELAEVIQPRLVRTPEDRSRELAERIAQAVFRATPIVVEGGDEATRLLLEHIDAVADRVRVDAQPLGPRHVRFGLPLLAAQFTGRDDELAELDRLFSTADRAVITQAGACQVG